MKAKIRYNGQEYSDPKQLPPEVREAYKNAVRGAARSVSNRILRRNFIVNGETFDDSNLPADARRLCDNVMSVIENNGEVTLPDSLRGEPWLTSGQWKFVAGVSVGLVSAATFAALRSLL